MRAAGVSAAVCWVWCAKASKANYSRTSLALRLNIKRTVTRLRQAEYAAKDAGKIVLP